MRTTKALQEENFFAYWNQAKLITTWPRCASNQTKLRAAQTTPHRKGHVHWEGWQCRWIHHQVAPPCQWKRHLLARMWYTGLPPNRSGPLSALTLAGSSPGVHSCRRFTLLRCCVPAFHFFGAVGTRRRTDSAHRELSCGKGPSDFKRDAFSWPLTAPSLIHFDL